MDFTVVSKVERESNLLTLGIVDSLQLSMIIDLFPISETILYVFKAQNIPELS